jgi:hypothetical protein
MAERFYLECDARTREVKVVAEVPKQQYSLEEQKTGEYWLDGKPIYVRTFVGNGPKQVNSGTADQVFAPGVVDTLLVPEIAYDANGLQFMGPVAISNATGDIRAIFRALREEDSGVRVVIWLTSAANAVYLNGKYRATLRYTKLADQGVPK